jgi:putative membrane protein
MRGEEMEKTKSSKFIQQHLANERTYLAWVRTAIAIIGIGFLVINLHFNFLSQHSAKADLMANIIGIAAVISGLFVIGFSTYSYFAKIKTIDNEVFKPEKNSVLLLTGIIIATMIMFGLYVTFIFS